MRIKKNMVWAFSSISIWFCSASRLVFSPLHDQCPITTTLLLVSVVWLPQRLPAQCPCRLLRQLLPPDSVTIVRTAAPVCNFASSDPLVVCNVALHCPSELPPTTVSCPPEFTNLGISRHIIFMLWKFLGFISLKLWFYIMLLILNHPFTLVG